MVDVGPTGCEVNVKEWQNLILIVNEMDEFLISLEQSYSSASFWNPLCVNF